MTQENVIARKNNKKNDKDNIRSEPSPGWKERERERAVSEGHELFIIMQKREKYATSFFFDLSNPTPQFLMLLSSSSFTTTMRTPLSVDWKIKYVLIALQKENVSHESPEILKAKGKKLKCIIKFIRNSLRSFVNFDFFFTSSLD